MRIFGHCAHVANASGPIHGVNNSLPKVMLSPEMASTMKQVAVIQHEALERIEAHERAPGTAASIRTIPDQEECDKRCEHAENCDRSNPAQCHLVNRQATFGLLENARLASGKNAPLYLLQLLQQLLLLNDCAVGLPRSAAATWQEPQTPLPSQRYCGEIESDRMLVAIPLSPGRMPCRSA
jgi:hypothetical protein